MSGHSKWAQIKRSKGVADAKRGQAFTRLAREIIIAVRQGGPNPEANARLRLAIQKARDNNMPMDNIDRAIKRGSGPGEGVALQEFFMEGYGPSGVAIILSVVTDNRNRTVQEIRNAFQRGGGNLAESGAVSWMFENRGTITVQLPGSTDPDEVSLAAIDAGAEDVKPDKEFVEVYVTPKDLETVRKALEQKGYTISSSEIAMVPKTMVNLDEESALKTMKLLDRLEELDDVQHVYSNMEFSDAVLEKLHSKV